MMLKKSKVIFQQLFGPFHFIIDLQANDNYLIHARSFYCHFVLRHSQIQDDVNIFRRYTSDDFNLTSYHLGTPNSIRAN